VRPESAGINRVQKEVREKITPRGEIEENRGECGPRFAKKIKTIKVTALHRIIEQT
jgi:hypothetical protein